nr:lysophospholipid acyltransferase family protein [Thermoanaerobaculia bacterium]
MRKLLDSFVGFASRWLARIFFRELEVVGRDRLPASGPLIVVANHVNSLVDPLLLLAAAGRPLRFLGKSTLWQNPFLVPVLSLAAVIPVYRRQDEGVDPAQNRETFARCHELLAKGGAIALFPEGISHNEPALAPLKTGAARIALEAEERFGPLGVKIVPVGLVFDAKEEFRSRALVEIGQPFGVEAELEQAKSAPQEASRALTGRIDQALHRVTLNYRSWGEAALIGRAADLFGRRTLAMPGERMFREDLELQRTLIDGFAELAGRYPAETRATA